LCRTYSTVSSYYSPRKRQQTAYKAMKSYPCLLSHLHSQIILFFHSHSFPSQNPQASSKALFDLHSHTFARASRGKTLNWIFQYFSHFHIHTHTHTRFREKVFSASCMTKLDTRLKSIVGYNVRAYIDDYVVVVI
jgi:hypothetical protein